MAAEDLVPVTRRDLLRGAAAGGVMLAVGAETVPGRAEAGAGTVTGIVFEDVVGDGLRRPDSRGLPGVLVSNGRDVAVTDAGGRYELPVSDETIVFVVKPAGFAPPLEPATTLPRFFYIHQPQGSPAALGLTFEGIAPTGPLPASVDFALRRQDEPHRFDVLLMTDPQPETEAELDFVRDDLMSAVGAIRPLFGMTIGDLLFDDLSMYPRYNRIIGTLGVPWWNVGGNHDLNFEAPDRRYSRETFKRTFGPPAYAFCAGEAVFIVLDDVNYLGLDRSKPNGSGKYEGRLDAAQLDFVANLLAHIPEDKLIVLAMHIPLRTYLDNEPYQNLVNRDELFKRLAGRRYTFSVSGHTHTTEHHYFGAADGWTGPEPHHHHVLTAMSGSWWSGPMDHRGVAVADSRDGTPNGFHVLSIDGNSYSTRFIPAKEPDARQIRLTVHSRTHDEMRRDFRPGALMQPRLPHAAVSAATLLANVFDGGPRTRVTAEIGGRAPLEMTRRPMPDPFVDEVFSRYEATRKAWVKAEISSHMYALRLPDLSPGTYPVTVTAVDEYGRRLSARIALEIEG